MGEYVGVGGASVINAGFTVEPGEGSGVGVEVRVTSGGMVSTSRPRRLQVASSAPKTHRIPARRNSRIVSFLGDSMYTDRTQKMLFCLFRQSRYKVIVSVSSPAISDYRINSSHRVDD